MVLVTDPFDKQKCDILTVSGVGEKGDLAGKLGGAVKREETFVISEEGEYEIGGIEVTALRQAENLIMMIRQNGITICHLGRPAETLSEKEVEKIGSVDVLLAPIGGKRVIKDKPMGELISDISPSIMVPMDYEKSGLDEFLEKNSLEVMLEGADKVKIDADALPENTKCLILKSRHNQ